MNLQNIKKFIFKNKYIFLGVIIILVLFFISHKNKNGDLLIDTVKRGDLTQTVLATGKVVSETDLNLSFNSSGVVKKINVKVGDKVKKGQILATLDQGALLANLTQARGSLLQAQAKYEDTISGSSEEEIALAKVLLENAKKEYEKTKIEQDLKVEKELNDLTRLTVNLDYLGIKDPYLIAKSERDTALINAQSLIDQRKAELDVKLAGAKDPDINLAQGEVLRAQGELELAQANLENSIIRAPSNGTITKVDVKIGELIEMGKEAIVIEDIENLYIEAKINEANINSVKVDNPVSIVYDSIGSENIFDGFVVSVDPSSTVEDGVVNYKIKIAIDQNSLNIKPGMNADISINTFKKENVLMVQSLAVLNNNGEFFVKVVTDEKRKKYKEIPVKIGIKGDGNIVEILEGINEGDKVFINKK